MTIDTDRSYQRFSGLISRSKEGKHKQQEEGRRHTEECFCDVQIPEITCSYKQRLHVWKSSLSADQVSWVELIKWIRNGFESPPIGIGHPHKNKRTVVAAAVHFH